MKIKILILLLLISSNVFAVQAEPGQKNFLQSTGSSFIGELKGDEWFNWIEDNLGRVIQYNPASSNYEYSVIKEIDGVLSLGFSGVIAADNTPLIIGPYSTVEIGKVDKSKFYIIAQMQRDLFNQAPPDHSHPHSHPPSYSHSHSH